MKKKNTLTSFGELESQIMDIMWKLHVASVRDVLTMLSRKKKVAYTTVMTVMSRLTKKGHLKRQKDDTGAYLYCPAQEKDDFAEQNSKKLIQSLLKEYGEVAVAQFIDAVESSKSKELEKWRKQLKKVK